jgi:hypothetical protein
MADLKDLPEWLIGQRFYDKQENEGFTVIGVTSTPPLALLQYDDGVGWDEGASNFTADEDTARKVGLDEHGLDSERYRPLGPGPRIDQTAIPNMTGSPSPTTFGRTSPPGISVNRSPAPATSTTESRDASGVVSPVTSRVSSAITGRTATTRRRGSATRAAASFPGTNSVTSAT